MILTTDINIWKDLSDLFKKNLSETEISFPTKHLPDDRMAAIIAELNAQDHDLSKFNLLFITQTVSAAIDLNSAFKQMIPDVPVSLLLPHTDDEINQDVKITIIPQANLFLRNYQHKNFWNDFHYIFVNVIEKTNPFIAFTEFATVASNIPKEALLIPCDLNNFPKSDIQSVNPANTQPKVPVPAPVKMTIQLSPSVTTPAVAQPASDITDNKIVYVDRTFKRAYLRNLLKKNSTEKHVIITRTRHNAHRLEEYLYQGRVRARIIHANLPEPAKNKVIDRYNNGEINIIIIPENAISQLTLEHVSQVFFFDLPDVSSDFKSRIDLILDIFNPQKCRTIVTNDEKKWIEIMEEETGYILDKEDVDRPADTILKTPAIAAETSEENTSHNRRSKTKFLRNNKDNSKQKPVKSTPHKKKESNHFEPDHSQEDFFNQASIINENRAPFASDSFEANIARENKKRVRHIFNQKTPEPKTIQEHYPTQPYKNNNNQIKIIRRKRRIISNDTDGNQ